MLADEQKERVEAFDGLVCPWQHNKIGRHA
jgi:hypothetical protein